MLKYFYIYLILTLFKLHHICSLINYHNFSKDKINITDLTSSFEINKQITGYISDERHFYSCDHLNNHTCSLVASHEKRIFAVPNGETLAIISRHNITFLDSQMMKSTRSYRVELDEITQAQHFKNDTLIASIYKENQSHLNLIKPLKSQNIKTLTGHTDRISSLLELSNGLLVSGSDDNNIMIWNPKNDYTLVTILKGHTSGITALLQLSNGVLVSGGDDSLINIWDSNNFSFITSLKDHTKWISCLFQLSSGMLVSGSGDASIKIWDAKNNYSLVSTLTGHTQRISSLLELSNGMLVSGCDDSTIKIWSANKNNNNYLLVTTLEEHKNWIGSLLQLSNGMLASADGDGIIKIWNPEDNFSLVTTLEGHTDSIVSLIQLSNGMLVSGAYDCAIKIWNPKDNFSLVATLMHTNWVTSLKELSNGMLASSSGDYYTKIWNPSQNYSIVDTLIGHTDRVNTIIQLSNQMIVSGSDDNTVKIWSLSTEADVKSHKTAHNQKIEKLLVFDEHRVVTTCSESICLNKYNIDKSNFETEKCKKIVGTVTNLLKLNEKTFLSTDSKGSITYWDIESLEIILQKHISEIRKSKESDHDTKKIAHVTKISNEFGKLIAALNTNHIIVLNESNLDLEWQDGSEKSNIVGILTNRKGVDEDYDLDDQKQNEFVSVHSDGLRSTYRRQYPEDL